MGNSSQLDATIYNILRIVNSINIVLFLSVLLSYIQLNKYISFTILIVLSGLIVVISRYLFDVIFKFDNENMESTVVYRGISVLSILSLLGYLAYNKEVVLIIILFSFLALFYLGMRYITKSGII